MRLALPIVVVALIAVALSGSPRAIDPAAPAQMKLLAFGNAHCQPCVQMQPVIDQLAAEGVTIERIDTDRDSAAVKQWRIRATPTYIAVERGKEVARVVGQTTLATLRRMIRRAVEPLQVLDKPAQPVVPAKPARGANGWRLRVLHRPGTANELRRLFREDSEVAEFGRAYGYEAISTDDERFQPWREFGYPADRTTIVLVNDRNEVVWKADEYQAPQTRDGLLAKLREAVSHRAMPWVADWGHLP